MKSLLSTLGIVFFLQMSALQAQDFTGCKAPAPFTGSVNWKMASLHSSEMLKAGQCLQWDVISLQDSVLNLILTLKEAPPSPECRRIREALEQLRQILLEKTEAINKLNQQLIIDAATLNSHLAVCATFELQSHLVAEACREAAVQDYIERTRRTTAAIQELISKIAELRRLIAELEAASRANNCSS